MGVAVAGQSQQGICERFRRKFAVERRSTILAQGICEFEGIELYIGVAVGEALDQGGNCLLWARGRGGDTVANVQYETPIFINKRFVGSLDYLNC